MAQQPAADEKKPKRVQENPTKCHFWVHKKSKFCTQPKLEGSDFCSIHAVLTLPKEAQETQKYPRVPCPINPTHTVNAAHLERHLRICPDRARDPKNHPAFAEDANNPGHGTSRITSAEDGKHGAAAKTALAPGYSFRDLDETELPALLNWIVATYDALKVEDEITRDHSTMASMSEYVATGKARHAQQHAALMQQLSTRCLQPVGGEAVVPAAVELGAGKAGLAMTLGYAFPPGSRVVVVDHTVFRDMKDNTMRKTFQMQVDRLTMNAKDFSFEKYWEAFVNNAEKVEEGKEDGGAAPASTGVEEDGQPPASVKRKESGPIPNRWLVIGKHLCGGCTDFALHCAGQEGVARASAAGHGVCVAVCCHHLCSHDTYRGELPSFPASGFPLDAIDQISPAVADSTASVFPTLRHFELTRSLCSWAVGGATVDETKRAVGRKAKRLIDFGRVLKLRQLGCFSQVAMIEYCDSSISEENIAIVGVPAAH